jgi:hypothetical protein
MPTSVLEQELGVVAACQAAGLSFNLTYISRRRWFLIFTWEPISSSPAGEPPQVCDNVLRIDAIPERDSYPGLRLFASFCYENRTDTYGPGLPGAIYRVRADPSERNCAVTTRAILF